MPTARSPGPSPFVALLRGVNVGGKNRLPMARLAALFEAAGAARVRTYIQSGNVLFEAASESAAPRLTNAWLDARLGTVSTLRNWRTAVALLALAAGRGEPPSGR